MWWLLSFWRLVLKAIPGFRRGVRRQLSFWKYRASVLCFSRDDVGTFFSPCGHPGRPLEQQEEHEDVRTCIWVVFVFGAIVAPHFEGLVEAEGYNSVCLVELVAKLFCTPELNSTFGHMGIVQSETLIEGMQKLNVDDLRIDSVAFF